MQANKAKNSDIGLRFKFMIETKSTENLRRVRDRSLESIEGSSTMLHPNNPYQIKNNYSNRSGHLNSQFGSRHASMGTLSTLGTIEGATSPVKLDPYYRHRKIHQQRTEKQRDIMNSLQAQLSITKNNGFRGTAQNDLPHIPVPTIDKRAAISFLNFQGSKRIRKGTSRILAEDFEIAITKISKTLKAAEESNIQFKSIKKAQKPLRDLNKSDSFATGQAQMTPNIMLNPKLQGDQQMALMLSLGRLPKVGDLVYSTDLDSQFQQTRNKASIKNQKRSLSSLPNIETKVKSQCGTKKLFSNTFVHVSQGNLSSFRVPLIRYPEGTVIINEDFNDYYWAPKNSRLPPIDRMFTEAEHETCKLEQTYIAKSKLKVKIQGFIRKKPLLNKVKNQDILIQVKRVNREKSISPEKTKTELPEPILVTQSEILIPRRMTKEERNQGNSYCSIWYRRIMYMEASDDLFDDSVKVGYYRKQTLIQDLGEVLIQDAQLLPSDRAMHFFRKKSQVDEDLGHTINLRGNTAFDPPHYSQDFTDAFRLYGKVFENLMKERGYMDKCCDDMWSLTRPKKKKE